MTTSFTAMTAQQYFVQALMWKQCCEESDVKVMITKSYEAASQSPPDSSQTSAQSFVNEINKSIGKYRMEISRGPNETNGTIHYSLVNTIDNDITRLSTEWTHKEMAYFRKLMAAIITSDEKCIHSIQALNIAREEGVSLSAAECLIDKWRTQKWMDQLDDDDDGSHRVAVGVRALLELGVYIRDRFEPYVSNCFRCKALCVRGRDCVHCAVRLHLHCADSEWIRDNKCPNCGKQWQSRSQDVSRSPECAQNNSSVDRSDRSASNEVVVESPPIITPRRSKRAKRSKRSN